MPQVAWADAIGFGEVWFGSCDRRRQRFMYRSTSGFCDHMNTPLSWPGVPL